MHDFVSRIRVIDTHEHLWDESWRLQNPGDFTALFGHYGAETLRSAGMTQGEQELLFDDPSASHEEKWRVFAKYWPLVQYTATMQAVVLCIRDIYGLDTPYSCESMRTLSARIRERVVPGFYRHVMQELSGIDFCLVCCFDRDARNNRLVARTWGDVELMRPDFTADRLLIGQYPDLLAQEIGMKPATFRQYEEAFIRVCDRYLSVCADIKIGLAYEDALELHGKPDFEAASAEYERHLETPLPACDLKAMRIYLASILFERAAHYKRPVKLHTGILCGSYSRTNLDVEHVAKLALQYPQVRFAMMHMAYPHQNEIPAALANIPNLYADLSWVWTLDPYSAKQLLKQLIYAVPIHKIMAFGGDYSLPENTYGNLLIARRMIAEALEEMVADGTLSFEMAEDIALWLLRKSALRFYRLDTQ